MQKGKLKINRSQNACLRAGIWYCDKRATKQNGRPFYQSLKSLPNNLKRLFKFQNDISIFQKQTVI